MLANAVKNKTNSQRPFWINQLSVQNNAGLKALAANTDWPRNEDMERLVVADILSAGELDDNASDLMHRLTQFLHYDHFYNLGYAATFKAMSRIIARGDAIGVETVFAEMSKTRAIDLLVGGKDALHQLASFVPHNTESHARILAEVALRRCMLHEGLRLQAGAKRTDIELDDLLVNAQDAVRGLSANVSLLSERNVYQAVDQQQYYQQLLTEADDPQHVTGIRIPLTVLERDLHGWRPDNLYSVAAGTGVGKSQLVVNLALDAAKRGLRVAIFTLEMSFAQMMDRLIASITGISGEKIQLRDLQADERELIVALIADENSPLHRITLVSMDYPTIQQLQAKIDDIYYRFGFDMVCIDYLAIETLKKPRENMHDNDHASHFWQEIKLTKKRYSVPFLVTTQVNRNYETYTSHRPRMTDIANSAICERVSDVVLIFNRLGIMPGAGDGEEKPAINHADISIEKNRWGKARRGFAMDLYYDEANGRIRDWPTMVDVEDAL